MRSMNRLTNNAKQDEAPLAHITKLGRIEHATLAQLASLKGIAPLINIRSYRGELEDAAALSAALSSGHAALLDIPRVRFVRETNRRFDAEAKLRVLLGVRAVDAPDTVGRATQAADLHSLWQACIKALDTFTADGALSTNLVPLKYAVLINRREKDGYTQVAAQTFRATWHWAPTRECPAPVTGIDLHYRLIPDKGRDSAHDAL